MGSVEGTIGDGAECPEPLATGVCSNEQLDASAEGIVEVVIVWPEADPALASDLNLFVYRCSTPAAPPFLATGCDQLVAQSIRDLGHSERAVFRVTSTPLDPTLCPVDGMPCALPGTFEARTTPASVLLLAETYDGCAAYDNSPADGFCPDPFVAAQPTPVPAGEFFVACPTGGSMGDRKVTGGGIFRLADSKKEHFAVNVERDDDGDDDDGDRKKDDDDGDGHRDSLEGSVKWKSDQTDRRFRSKALTCATFFDGSKSVFVRGLGTIREDNGTKRTVCFENIDDDNGSPGGTEDGGSDSFRVSFFDFNPGTSASGDETCNTGAGETHGGPISKGNIKYQFKA